MSTLLLEIVEGPSAGRRIELGDDPLVFGRGDEVDVALDDDTAVSRTHARVTPAGVGATVEDLGSSNGTFVNRIAVTSATALQPGDDLLVGTTVLELRRAGDLAAQPSAVRAVPAGLAAPQRPPAYVPDDALREPPPSGERAQLDVFLDRRTKTRARLAPLAIAVLVVFVVLIYLATR